MQNIENFVKADMKVDTEEYVLKNTGNDQDDVEHGLETIEVLRNIQKVK